MDVNTLPDIENYAVEVSFNCEQEYFTEQESSTSYVEVNRYKARPDSSLIETVFGLEIWIDVYDRGCRLRRRTLSAIG